MKKALKFDQGDIVRIFDSISKYMDENPMNLKFKNASIKEVSEYFHKNAIIIKEAQRAFIDYKKQQIEVRISRKKKNQSKGQAKGFSK